MKRVKRTPARTLIATAPLLLGLQVILPFTRRIKISAQIETATAKLESCAAAEGNRKLPADLIALAPMQEWIARPGESFYADGTAALRGVTEGSLIFVPQAMAVGSHDPRGPGMTVGADSLALLASNDDTAISGVRYITSSSPFFPRQR